MRQSVGVAVICCAAILLASYASVQSSQFVDRTWHPTRDDFLSFMDGSFTGQEGWVELRRKVLSRVQDYAASYLQDHGVEPRIDVKADEYPYFAFIPPYMASAVPEGLSVSWQGFCFQNSSAIAVLSRQNTSVVTLTFTLSNPVSSGCSDRYLLATLSGAQLRTFKSEGSHSFVFTLRNGASQGEVWDFLTKGIRIFQFTKDPLDTISYLLTTALLFGSEATLPVPQWVSDLNVDFLAKYAGFKMARRATPSVEVDESLINPGDYIAVTRLDGVDPMIGWAMGSSTGHATVALRDPADGTLYVCESTIKDSYWPLDGIQKTPYAQWIQQARDASMHVVWAPLAPEISAAFNNTAAWEMFNQLQGLEYGFRNFLWGWVDTLEDNYPCIPPNYTQCVTWKILEVFFGIADHVLPEFTRLMIAPAFNNRLNTSGLNISELFYQANQQAISSEEIPAMVELDSYNYTTTRYNQTVVSKSQVCCVFVCNMWKAGGVFDAIGRDLNCAELTNADDVSLEIFDTVTARPSQCVEADPDNPLCQLEGEYTLLLNGLNTRAPYAHMAEKCPSEPPYYKRPDDC